MTARLTLIALTCLTLGEPQPRGPLITNLPVEIEVNRNFAISLWPDLGGPIMAHRYPLFMGGAATIRVRCLDPWSFTEIFVEDRELSDLHFGDFDYDGDVDLYDFATLQHFFTGPQQ